MGKGRKMKIIWNYEHNGPNTRGRKRRHRKDDFEDGTGINQTKSLRQKAE
jgi:hypothetical protein